MLALYSVSNENLPGNCDLCPNVHSITNNAKGLHEQVLQLLWVRSYLHREVTWVKALEMEIRNVRTDRSSPRSCPVDPIFLF